MVSTGSTKNQVTLPESSAGPRVGILVSLACLTALLLNHSARIAGLNLSLADPLMIMALFALIFAKRMIIPPYVLLFFALVVSVSLITSVTVTPGGFGINPDETIIVDLLKLTVSLLYVICGSGLASLGINMKALRWFATGTAVIAVAGIAMELTGVRLLSDVMYYGDWRYRGFMLDPNYWAVLACAAIVFFARDPGRNVLLRTALIASLVVTILMSASKTGLISLLLICAIGLLEKCATSRHRVSLLSLLMFTGIVLALTWNSLIGLLQSLVDRYSEILPQLTRISILLHDPIGAISEGGSGRSSTWESGISIIESSPFLGVGIGSYRAVNDSLYGSRGVAHNTYLQLAAEWGLPLACAFLIWVVVLLARATITGTTAPEGVDLLILRDIIVVFLVGSLSLSLNNARMFWFFLGMLIYIISVRQVSQRKPRGIVSRRVQ